MFNNQSDYGYIQMHDEIVRSGRYSFDGCKFPLKPNLRIDYFRFVLHGYKNECICNFLEYGFPWVSLVKCNAGRRFICYCQKSWWGKQLSIANSKILIERKIIWSNPRTVYQ